MKNSVVLAVAVLVSMVLPITGILGQESGNEGVDKTSDSGKKWALQFQIDKSTFLTAFNGSTISVMKKIDDSRSWRVGISLNGSMSDNKEKQYLKSDSLVSSMNTNLNTINLQLSFQYLLKKRIHKNVNCYYGLGPTFLFDGNIFKIKDYPEYNYPDYKNTNSSYGAGLSGVIGAEWWFHEFICFTAEYNSAFIYKKAVSIQENLSNRSKLTRNQISLISSPVRFGVTVVL